MLRYENGPAGDRARDFLSTASSVYADLCARASREFPSWSSDPELLRETVLEVWALVTEHTKGGRSILIRTRHAGDIVMHFSGGRAFIDPDPRRITLRMIDVLRLLHLLMGDRLQAGGPGEVGP